MSIKLPRSAVCQHEASCKKLCHTNCQGQQFYGHFWPLLKTAKQTADLGSSVHTFFCGLKLLTSAVLSTLFFVESNCWSWQFYGHGLKLQTLAVCVALFSPHGVLVTELQTLAVCVAVFGPGPVLESPVAHKTADLGSLCGTFHPRRSNCWPRQFVWQFSAPLELRSQNCRPWQFVWQFSARAKSVHKTADLGSLYGTVVKLQTLAVCVALFRKKSITDL